MADGLEKKPGGEVFPHADTLRKRHKERRPGSRRRMIAATLALCTVLAAGGAYLARNVKPDAAPTPGATQPARLKLIEKARADFKEATVAVRGDAGYTIEVLDGGLYGMRGAANFKVNQSLALGLVTSLTYMICDGRIEAPADLSAFGLNEPRAVVSAAYRDDVSRTFLLGDQTPSSSGYYLMERGDPDVYIVHGSGYAYFTATRRQMHTARLPQLAMENILGASLTAKGQETIKVGYRFDMPTLSNSSLWLTAPVLYEADRERVETYFNDIAGIRLVGFEDDAAEAELSAYGLDEPQFHLLVTGQNQAGEPITAMELFIGDRTENETTYARIDETNDVYLLDSASLAFLADISTARLVDRFANGIDIAIVDGIRISLPDGTSHQMTIRRAPDLGEDGRQNLNAGGQPMFIEAFALDGVPVPDKTFRKLYQIIIGTRVDGMIPEGKTPDGTATPLLTVQYRLNSVREEELIEYLSYDADHYALRRNGVCMFYILKSRVDRIAEAIRAYENGSFDPEAFGV